MKSVSNIIKRVKDYRLNSDERTVLDWLLVCTDNFGSDWLYSVNLMSKELHINRATIKKILTVRFEPDGWLVISNGTWNRQRLTRFSLNKKKLSEKLHKYFHEDSQTYNDLLIELK